MYSSRDFRSRGRHWDSEEDFHVPPSARRPASYHLPAINPMQASSGRPRSPPVIINSRRGFHDDNPFTPGVTVYPSRHHSGINEYDPYLDDYYLATTRNGLIRPTGTALPGPVNPRINKHAIRPHVSYIERESYLEKERTASREGSHSLSKCDTIWNTSMTRDVTIHLTMDTEEDLEGKLGEFIQYQRIGNFKAAENYFVEHLSRVADDLSVVTQYADMLIDQGANRFLLELIPNADILALHEALETGMVAPTSQRIKLLLLVHKANGIVNGSRYLPRSFNRIARMYSKVAEKENRWANPSAIDVDVINALYGVRNLDFDIGVDWAALYTTLLKQNRLLDLWKILHSLLGTHGPFEPFIIVTGKGNFEQGLSKVLQDWQMTISGEAGLLPLLDILTDSLNRSTMTPERNDSGSIRSHEICLQEQARLVASLVRKHTPGNMQSRAYIFWIIREECMARSSQKDEMSGGRGVPGTFLPGGSLPVYAPREAENPGNIIGASATYDNGLLDSALRTAEGSGDYQLQRSALCELIGRSIDPTDLFMKLEHVEREIFGHRKQLLTMLSKYLFVKNDPSREALRKDLIELDPRLGSGYSGSMEWCRLRILRALSISLRLNSELIQDLEDQIESSLYETRIYPHSYPIPTRSTNRWPDFDHPRAADHNISSKQPYVEDDPEETEDEGNIVIHNASSRNIDEQEHHSTLRVPGGINTSRSRSTSHRRRPSFRRPSSPPIPIVRIMPPGTFRVVEPKIHDWPPGENLEAGLTEESKTKNSQEDAEPKRLKEQRKLEEKIRSLERRLSQEKLKRTAEESDRRQHIATDEDEEVREHVPGVIGISSIDSIGHQVREQIKSFMKDDLPEIVRDFRASKTKPTTQTTRGRKSRRKANRDNQDESSSYDSKSETSDSLTSSTAAQNMKVRRQRREDAERGERGELRERRPVRRDHNTTLVLHSASRNRHESVNSDKNSKDNSSTLPEPPPEPEHEEVDPELDPESDHDLYD